MKSLCLTDETGSTAARGICTREMPASRLAALCYAFGSPVTRDEYDSPRAHARFTRIPSSQPPGLCHILRKKYTKLR